MDKKENKIYDVFLSHSHKDAECVESFAEKLEDDHNIKVWLDKWILIPGEPFRQKLAKGLKTAKTCAVFIGKETPIGWFNEEISKALNIQIKHKDFRVIPVLLPGSDESYINDFLELRTWVDFRKGLDNKRSFHELFCGIKGIKPGRELTCSDYNMQQLKKKLRGIEEVSPLVEKSVKREVQKMILIEYFIKGKNE